MAPLQNFTVPADWTDHGIPGLVCQPATWTSIASFFISNFVAHAFTLKSEPGQTTRMAAFAALMALFYPSFGVGRAIISLVQSAKLPFGGERDALRDAQRAGALCMVVRSPAWQPAAGDEIRNLTREDLTRDDSMWTRIWKSDAGPASIAGEKICQSGQQVEGQAVPLFDLATKESASTAIEVTAAQSAIPEGHCGGSDNSVKKVDSCDSEEAAYRVFEPAWLSETGSWVPSIHSTRPRRVHGTYILPPGYSFATVPAHFEISSHRSTVGAKAFQDLPTSSSPVTVAVGLYQIASGAVTLYWTRGDQLKLYGYASYSLAVIPYIFMTAINLTAQLFTDDYPVLFMVETDIMREAMNPVRGGVFHGMVGEIETVDMIAPSNPMLLPEENLGTIKVLSTAEQACGQLLAVGKWSTGGASEGQNIHARLIPADANIEYDNILRIPSISFLRVKASMLGDTQRLPLQRPFWPGEVTLIVASINALITPIAFSALLVLIVYGVTQFNPGSEATPVQHAFIIAWIVCGAYFGVGAFMLVELVKGGFLSRGANKSFVSYRRSVYWMVGVAIICATLYATPAIGGMVVAGLQMKAYGDCSRVEGPF